jgi:hypothetical protein
MCLLHLHRTTQAFHWLPLHVRTVVSSFAGVVGYLFFSFITSFRRSRRRATISCWYVYHRVCFELYRCRAVLCVCVCVCLCHRERERETSKEEGGEESKRCPHACVKVRFSVLSHTRASKKKRDLVPLLMARVATSDVGVSDEWGGTRRSTRQSPPLRLPTPPRLPRERGEKNRTNNRMGNKRRATRSHMQSLALLSLMLPLSMMPAWRGTQSTAARAKKQKTTSPSCTPSSPSFLCRLLHVATPEKRAVTPKKEREKLATSSPSRQHYSANRSPCRRERVRS